MDDIRAVMEASGSSRAAVMGLSEGGALAALFGATYPDKTVSLVLWGAIPRVLAAPDYPNGFSPEVIFPMTDTFDEIWGTGLVITSTFAPSMAFDPGFKDAAARVERLAATPRAFAANYRMFVDYDVRFALGLLRMPVLVLDRPGQVAYLHGRYVAEHCPGSRLIEYSGIDHFPWFGDNSDEIADDIAEFVTGERARPLPDTDRVLATVLFTDIVDSTKRATLLGDRRWRDLLERHDDTLKTEIDRFSGRLVKTTGDGCLATFDGPGRAVRCAAALRDMMRGSGIDIRAGLHAREVELRGDDIGGIAVHIGSRVASLASPSEVLVSSTVKDLITGSGIEFTDRGEHELKGVPGTWRLYAVTG